MLSTLRQKLVLGFDHRKEIEELEVKMAVFLDEVLVRWVHGFNGGGIFLIVVLVVVLVIILFTVIFFIVIGFFLVRFGLTLSTLMALRRGLDRFFGCTCD